MFEHQPAEKLTLRVESGNAAGDVIDVADELLIGRQAPGAGKLGEDIEISRRHARLFRNHEGRFVIEDLGSTNGTWVNGRRVDESPLAPGDQIELGGTRLVVDTTTAVTEVEAPAAAAMEPEPEPQPESVAEPEPEPEPEVFPPPPPPVPAVVQQPAIDIDAPGRRIAIRIEIEGDEVTVELDDPAGPARFVKRNGQWAVE